MSASIISPITHCQPRASRITTHRTSNPSASIMSPVVHSHPRGITHHHITHQSIIIPSLIVNQHTSNTPASIIPITGRPYSGASLIITHKHVSIYPHRSSSTEGITSHIKHVMSASIITGGHHTSSHNTHDTSASIIIPTTHRQPWYHPSSHMKTDDYPCPGNDMTFHPLHGVPHHPSPVIAAIISHQNPAQTDLAEKASIVFR